MRQLLHIKAGSPSDRYTQDQLAQLAYEYHTYLIKQEAGESYHICAHDNYTVTHLYVDESRIKEFGLIARYSDGRDADEELQKHITMLHRHLRIDQKGAITVTHFDVEIEVTYDPFPVVNPKNVIQSTAKLKDFKMINNLIMEHTGVLDETGGYAEVRPYLVAEDGTREYASTVWQKINPQMMNAIKGHVVATTNVSAEAISKATTQEEADRKEAKDRKVLETLGPNVRPQVDIIDTGNELSKERKHKSETGLGTQVDVAKKSPFHSYQIDHIDGMGRVTGSVVVKDSGEVEMIKSTMVDSKASMAYMGPLEDTVLADREEETGIPQNKQYVNADTGMAENRLLRKSEKVEACRYGVEGLDPDIKQNLANKQAFISKMSLKDYGITDYSDPTNLPSVELDEEPELEIDDDMEDEISDEEIARQYAHQLIDEFLSNAGEENGENSGFNVDYYTVCVKDPKRPNRLPYMMEVEDIIAATNMNFHEGTIFKSLIRSVNEREFGLQKQGNDSIRDAEKMNHSSKQLLNQRRAAEGLPRLK